MRVRWTHTAIGHLTSIYDYIGRDSQHYAQRTVDRITARSKQISDFPHAGQMVPEYNDPNVREVIEGFYRIIYEISQEEVRVLAVIHGAQLLPPEPLKDSGA